MENFWLHQHPSPLIPSWPGCPSLSLLLEPSNPRTKRWWSSIMRCFKMSKQLPPPTTTCMQDILGSSWTQLSMPPIMAVYLSHRLTPWIIHGSPLLPYHAKKMRHWHAINGSCWDTMNMELSWFDVATNSKKPSMKTILLICRTHGWASKEDAERNFWPCPCLLCKNYHFNVEWKLAGVQTTHGPPKTFCSLH